MFRFILLTGLLLSAFTIVFGQPGVVVQHPVDDLTQYQDVYVAEGGRGYAVGSCGTIATTTNSGMSWTSAQSPNAIDYTTVACVSGTNCLTILLVGSNTLARSTNAGVSWSYDVSDDWAFIDQLHTPGNNVVIADKGFNSLRKSTNGGSTWTDIDLPENQRTALLFTSATTGYYFANGTNNCIKTTNAGDTWASTGYAHPTSVSYISFVDNQTGFLFDQDRKIFRTTNGGVSWTDMNTTTSLPSNMRVFAALSATQLGGVSVTDRLFQSNDAGATWTSTEISDDDGVFVKQKYHRRGNEFWLASNLSEIYYSAADFTNWQSGIPADRIDINAILMTQNGVGYAVDANGGILKTTNNGDDWNALTTTPAFFRGSVMEQLPDGRLLGLFASQYPLVSSNGGVTWTDYLPQSARDFLGFNYPTTFSILPGGRQYFIDSEKAVYSDNNGATWNLVTHTDNISIRRMHFVDANVGYGAGYGGGQMARTLDGGLNWENITANTPTNQPLNDFYFTDQNNGIVFGGSTSYRTTNGGDSWTGDNSLPGGYEVIKAPNGDLFTNEFGSGNNAEFWRSQDNGQTWESIGYVCAPSRAASMSPDGSFYFGAGDGGMITRIDVSLISSVSVPAHEIKPITAFPNPTNGLTNIELPQNIGSQPVTIEVFNLAGQSIYRTVVSSQPIVSVDLSQQPVGVYTFKMKGNGWLQSGKVVRSQ